MNLDGQLISDMERDNLHREVYRTQGKLTSCFGYDLMGRKCWQFASTLPADKLSGVLGSESPQLLVEHAYNPIHRRYQYDPAGELVRTLDKLRGEIKYEYEANGQLHSRDIGKLVDSEELRYDPAANRLNLNTRRFDYVKHNRLHSQYTAVKPELDQLNNVPFRKVERYTASARHGKYTASDEGRPRKWQVCC